MMSARKKQGLPPVQKGTQPRIRIRPHTGKKKRQVLPPVASAVPPRRSLNEKVLQQPQPQPKNKKILKKQNSGTRTQSVRLARRKMLRSIVPVSVVVVVIAGLWSVAGTVSLPIVLAVLGIGGGAGLGGYFYSKLLRDKERLRNDYERLMRSAADKPLPSGALQQDFERGFMRLPITSPQPAGR